MDSVPVDDQETVRGDLGLGTLPAIIRKLHEDRSTGTLHIRARGSEQRVHFQWGAVVFAGSDRREDRLDKRLRAEGLVELTKLEEAHQAQESSGKRFGECLIELGVLSEAELLEAVERQVRSIVTFLFSLDRGEYHFEETDEPVEQDLALDLPMREIIVDGIRSMDDPIALQISVGAMTDYLHVGIASQNANVNAAEGFVLSRVDGRTNILDILSVSPLGEVETLRSICALLAVGVVEAKPEPLVVPKPAPTPPAPKEVPAPPEPSLSSSEAVAEASPQAPPEAPQPEAAKPQAAKEEESKELSEDDKRRAAEQRYQVARRLFSDAQFYEAIGVLMEVVRLDGTQAPYHVLLARAYARNPKWRASAIEHFEKAVELDEYDEKTYYLLGLVYEEEGRVEEARAAFEHVLSLEPNHERARKKLQSKGVVSRLKSIFKKTSHG